MLWALLLIASVHGLGGCDSFVDTEDAQTSEHDQQQKDGSLQTDVDKAMSACAQYKGKEKVYGYCLSKYVVSIMAVDEMLPVCAETGEWADRCRHTWVSARQRLDSGYSTGTLLNVCMGYEDCIFELLSFRYAKDVYAQVERCVAWTDKYEEDCIDHAIQHWYFDDHTAAEIDELINTLGPAHPERVSYWVAATVTCGGSGSCGDRSGHR